MTDQNITEESVSSGNNKIKNKVLLVISLSLIILVSFLYVYLSFRVKKSKPSLPDQNHQEEFHEAYIEITENGFFPETILVKKGTIVTFIISDTNLHKPATDSYKPNEKLSNFTPDKNLAPNERYSFKFSEPGSFNFYDEKNPNEFHLVVVVEE